MEPGHGDWASIQRPLLRSSPARHKTIGCRYGFIAFSETGINSGRCPSLLMFPVRLVARRGSRDRKMNIAPNPSFEDDLTGIETNVCVFGGWFPIGVVTEDGRSEIRIVEGHARTGKRSLRVTPNSNTVEGTRYYSQYNGGEEVRTNVTRPGVRGARTLAFRLDQDIRFCDASVWIRKARDQEIVLKAIWYTRRDRIPFIKMSEQAVTEPMEDQDGWYRYALHAMRPHMARQVQIAVETDDDASPFYIDDVDIYFNRARTQTYWSTSLATRHNRRRRVSSCSHPHLCATLQLRFHWSVWKTRRRCFRASGRNSATTASGICITGKAISQPSKSPAATW